MSEHPISYYAINHNIKHTVINNAIRDFLKGKPWGLKAQLVPLTTQYIVEQSDFEVWYTRYQQNRQNRQKRKATQMENLERISNEDLHQKYPSLHEQASETMCNEQNYAAVDAWLVEKDAKGTVTGVYEPIFAGWYKK